MTELTEYGELALTLLDEWGFRRIGILMENGRRIIVVAVPPPIVKRIIGDGLVWIVC